MHLVVPNAQINDFKLHLDNGDEGGSDVGIDTLTLHDLFIWKKFLDIYIMINVVLYARTPPSPPCLLCDHVVEVYTLQWRIQGGFLGFLRTPLPDRIN